jgi:hypothetical protein
MLSCDWLVTTIDFLMILVAMDEPIPYWGKIAEKLLFAQTQTHCHYRDLTETGSGFTGGSYDRPQTQTPCANPQTAH